jgi:ubiquinol-cytochrome c reductase iron-sulfur subunit
LAFPLGGFSMSSEGVNTTRRRFLATATSVVGAGGVVGVAVPFVGSWNPSAKAKAAGAPVKFDVSKLEVGQMAVVEWRGKPVYVMRRSESDLASLEGLDSHLKDPASSTSDQPAYVSGRERAIRQDIMVMVGLCTHLGCAPKFKPEVGSVPTPDGSEWIGGFFCPCHGSMFDLAGRVYKGVPASENLVVPPYMYESDGVIVIGVDQEAA